MSCRHEVAASALISTSSSKPATCKYQRSPRATSARASCSFSQYFPANWCGTPRSSTCTMARQRSPSLSQCNIQPMGLVTQEGSCRPKPSAAFELEPQLVSDAQLLSASSRVPSFGCRRCEPQRPMRRPSVRSAASRWASFLLRCQDPTMWWGKPSKRNATVARNSRPAKSASLASKFHCRIRRLVGKGNPLEDWTYSCSRAMGLLSAPPPSACTPSTRSVCSMPPIGTREMCATRATNKKCEAKSR
mmetsp:Transcript_2392/g.6916  ORF Transcript_2392/g.6916 Transcript_2392/m.6916 type:complete len:247 (-) Transcript_2392:2-742(-)